MGELVMTPRAFRVQKPGHVPPPPRFVLVEWWQYMDDGSSAGRRAAGSVGARIRLANRGTETVTPEYGEPYERTNWGRMIEVHVSKTGRSVRIWVDGREVPAPTHDTEGNK